MNPSIKLTVIKDKNVEINKVIDEMLGSYTFRMTRALLVSIVPIIIGLAGRSPGVCNVSTGSSCFEDGGGTNGEICKGGYFGAGWRWESSTLWYIDGLTGLFLLTTYAIPLNMVFILNSFALNNSIGGILVSGKSTKLSFSDFFVSKLVIELVIGFVFGRL